MIRAIAAGVCLGVALDALAAWCWINGIGPQFEDQLHRPKVVARLPLLGGRLH